jgi:hypothetical protein
MSGVSLELGRPLAVRQAEQGTDRNSLYRCSTFTHVTCRRAPLNNPVASTLLVIAAGLEQPSSHTGLLPL